MSNPTEPARLLCSWDSSGRNTGVGGHALLQGIFPNHGSNPHLFCLLHWQTCSLLLACHLGSPYKCRVKFKFFASMKLSQPAQSLSCVRLFATPWTAACQVSLSVTNPWNLLKLMSIESVMSSSHLFLCHPLLLLPSVFPASGNCLRWI